jgi:hypothetical protein
MATYTDTLGFNKGSAAAYPDKGRYSLTKIEVQVSLPSIAAARTAAGATTLASGDVLEVLRIPAKTQVLAVGADVTTASGATLTIDLGDGADIDGFLDGVNANTAAGYSSTTVTLVEGAPNTLSPAFGFGKYYGSADTIDVIFNNTPGVLGVMNVWAVLVDCS